MKSIIYVFLLTYSVLGLSQTMEERQHKNSMLSRIDQMIFHAERSYEHLLKLDLAQACENISLLFDLYPHHLTDIGTKMNLFSPKIKKIRDDALNDLKEVHRQKNRCDKKANFMAVDPEIMEKEVKLLIKSLKKHKKVIKKNDTNFNNSFYYRYEFQD